MDYETDRPRRIRLFTEARGMILADPDAFTTAGRKLAELFPAERPDHTPDPFAEEFGALQPFTIISRITLAVRTAIAPRGDGHEHAGWFDYDTSGADENGPLYARMTILVILLAADPRANEAITPEVCELSALPWDTGRDDELGREWIDWKDPEWAHQNDPPPRVFDRLEGAISFLLSEPDQKVSRRPTERELMRHLRASSGKRQEFPRVSSSDIVRVLNSISVNELEPRSNTKIDAEKTQSVPAVPLAAVPRPAGWTRATLIDQANLDNNGGKNTLSPSTFDNIRKEAGIAPAERGGKGAQRHFSTAQLRQLIDAVEAGSFLRKREIAAAWRQLLPDPPKK